MLSAKGARRLGQIALREIHRSLVHDSNGRHETRRRGPIEIVSETLRPYEHGDPLHVDVHTSLDELRDFYDLESLWVEAPRLPLAVPSKAAG